MLRVFLVSKVVVKVSTKIYKKSCSTVSTTVDKRHSVKFEDSPPTFALGKLHGMKKSNTC